MSPVKRYSATSVRGLIARFVSRNIGAKKLQKLCDSLPPREQAELIVKLLPYILAPMSAETLSKDEIDQLYTKLETAVKAK